MNGKRAGSSTQTELVDIKWVAKRLGVTVRHIRPLVAEKRIPIVKWGHLVRFDPQEIELWPLTSRRSSFLPAVSRGGPCASCVSCIETS